MKKCVLTGASGLLGTAMSPFLSPDEWEVFAVIEKGQYLPSSQWHKIEMDLRDTFDYSMIPEQVDVIVHLAQSPYFRVFPEQSMELIDVNVRSTLQLLDYARRAECRHFVMTSTGGVYPGCGIMHESDVIDVAAPRNFYAASKLCAEILCECYKHLMNIVILRPFFIYGPGQMQDMLIPRLINAVKNRKPVMIDGEDGFETNPVFVEDCANAVYQAMALEGYHIINIGGPEVLNIRQMVECIAEILGQDPLIVSDSSKQAHCMAGALNCMRELLGAPRIYFADGVKQMLGGRK